jgi:hypothetical protein
MSLATTVTGIVTAAIPGLGPAVNTVQVGSTMGVSAANSLEATFFSSRVIAIVLGLILITGAILLYIGEDLAGAIEAGKSGAAKVAAVGAAVTA